MIRKELESIVWLEFELLAPFKNLTHGVLLRHGGYSTEGYESLNLGFSLNNPIENQNVQSNRNKVKKVFAFKSLHDSILMHEDSIVEITNKNRESRPTCDAITTKLSGIPLMVTHADCQAAIFYDPLNHAIANVHSGWKGNVRNIYAKTVNL